MVRRVDAVHRQPVLDIGDVEAQERADLVEGDPALMHQTSHESLRDPEPRSQPDDVQHPLPIRRLTISFPCHVPHRESTRGTRGSSLVRTVDTVQVPLPTNGTSVTLGTEFELNVMGRLDSIRLPVSASAQRLSAAAEAGPHGGTRLRSP